MLLTITLDRSEFAPATDLGFLLHKNPFRPEPQLFKLPFGTARVFWPEVGDERATAALALAIDPVGLVRRPAGGEAFALGQYVNDRPYAVSSFLAVAIGEVFGTALSGRCAPRPDLVERPLPLSARLVVLPSRGGADFVERLFAPLGYTVASTPHPLDPSFPAWGESPYLTVELRGQVRLRDLLAHLTVLIPVLDGAKHYYVGPDEIDKLLRRGAGWLAGHPERELIAARYLRYRRGLVREAVARLLEEDVAAAGEAEPESPAGDAEVVEAVEEVAKAAGLHQLRLETVVTVLKERGAGRVLDLGCGEGRLLSLLLTDPQFVEIVGVDASHRALDRAADRLRLDRLPPAKRERIRLLHGSLTYRDARLSGYDTAAVVEVLEHLDPWRLEAFARALFGEARPATVVVTTPNREFNVHWPDLPAGDRRHPDHRFEWTRVEFRGWADGVAGRFGYAVRLVGIGPEDAEVGAPSQMAVFVREDHGAGASLQRDRPSIDVARESLTTEKPQGSTT
jgi:3' terminal RNA ribose 2'-O-methyltransferase Hen1